MCQKVFDKMWEGVSTRVGLSTNNLGWVYLLRILYVLPINAIKNKQTVLEMTLGVQLQCLLCLNTSDGGSLELKCMDARAKI